MTNNDMIERIARAAATSEGFGPDQPDHEIVTGEYLSDAQFLAPFIAEEVRKAKAEALRGVVEKYSITIPDILGDKMPAVTVEDLLDTADEYESGDQ